MDETPFPPDENELTEQDLAILRAFAAMEDLPVAQSSAPITSLPTPTLAQSDNDETDMAVLFATEAAEDIDVMRQAIRQLERQEQDGNANMTQFRTLQRTAHKLKGTAAAIDCIAISAIARALEVLSGQVASNLVPHSEGLPGLRYALLAIEATLQDFIEEEQEKDIYFKQLATDLQELGLDLLTLIASSPAEPMREQTAASDTTMLVEQQHFEQLLLHTGQLAELRAPLELAQAQVEQALQELDAAQARLRRLEMLFTITALPMRNAGNRPDGPGFEDEIPASPLIARILDEALERTGRPRKSRVRPRHITLNSSRLWDELEIDCYTESDILSQQLSEAIADITTASAQLQTAFAQLHRLLQKQTTQAASVRNDTLRLPPHQPRPGGDEGSRAGAALKMLLVRVGSQQVGIPLAQVRRIDHAQSEKPSRAIMTLNALLGFPLEERTPETLRPLLLLEDGAAVAVDEVGGETELVVKPLAPYLQRPDITGAAIDGTGNILLIVDVAALLQHAAGRSPTTESAPKRLAHPTEQGPQTILIADDSVYMRKSLKQTLHHAGYIVTEARDGTEALQYLTEYPPNLLILDVEMPNLDGYELLSIIRTQPALAHMKIVMLTSRSSEKYQQRAYELGAHAYLSKPCPEDSLLQTLAMLLAN